LASKRCIRFQCQTFVCEVIDHAQHTDRPSARDRITQKIQRPFFVGVANSGRDTPTRINFLRRIRFTLMPASWYRRNSFL
jgi:hypothetical protein